MKTERTAPVYPMNMKTECNLITQRGSVPWKITERIMREEEQEEEEKVRRKEEEGKSEQEGRGNLLLMSQFYQLMHFSWVPTSAKIRLC